MKLEITHTYEVPVAFALTLIPAGSGGTYAPGTAASLFVRPESLPDPISTSGRREATPEESENRRDAERFDSEFA